jgi:hypothetical protein
VDSKANQRIRATTTRTTSRGSIVNKEEKETIANMVCLIVGCTLIGSEFGTGVGLGLFLILLTFA